MIKKDRRTYLYDASDVNSLTNAPNRTGHTPLYIATQNGNLEMVKYLISKRANPLQKSKVSATESESNLAVATRWKHAKIAEYYLENYKWPYEDLRQAKRAAGNPALRRMVAEHMARVKPSGCLCFCRSAEHSKKAK